MIGPDQDIEARWAEGLSAYGRMFGISSDEVAERMKAQLGERLAREAILSAGAGTWAETPLSRRDRSLIVMAILMTLGGAEPRLEIHATTAIEHGATIAEIEEMGLIVALYAGYARGSLGIETVRKALNS